MVIWTIGIHRTIFGENLTIMETKQPTKTTNNKAASTGPDTFQEKRAKVLADKIKQANGGKLPEPSAEPAAKTEEIKQELPNKSPKMDGRSEEEKKKAEEEATIKAGAEKAEKAKQEAEAKIAAEKAEAEKKKAEIEQKVKAEIPDYLKGDDDEVATSEVKTEDKTQKPDEESDKRIATLIEAEKRLTALLENPIGKVLVEFAESGETDIAALAAKISVPSLDGKTDEQKYEIYLKTTYNDLTEDEIAEGVAEFSALSKIERKGKMKGIEAELAKMREEKLSGYSATTTEQKKQQEKERIEFERFRDTKKTEAAQELKQKLDAFKENRNFMGYSLTDTDLQNIEKSVQSRAVVKTENGKFAGYDIKKSVEEAIWLDQKLRREILKKNYELGMTAGEDLALTERKRADAGGVDLSRVAQESKSDTLQSALKNATTKNQTKGRLEKK